MPCVGVGEKFILSCIWEYPVSDCWSMSWSRSVPCIVSAIKVKNYLKLPFCHFYSINKFVYACTKTIRWILMCGALDLWIESFFSNNAKKCNFCSFTRKIQNLQGYILIFVKVMKTTFFHTNNYTVIASTTVQSIQFCASWFIPIFLDRRCVLVVHNAKPFSRYT